jgi:transcriptional regulator with XRE-family HTH domain
VRKDRRTAADKPIGERVRARRLGLGMSQEALAKAIGLTFQQVQKYENAKNRISAGRLVQIAAALNCNPADFFAPIGERLANGTDELLRAVDQKVTLRLLRAFQKLPPKQRHAFVRIVETWKPDGRIKR